MGLLFCSLIALAPRPVGAQIAVSVNGVATAGEVTATFRLHRFVGDADRVLAEGTLMDVAGVQPTSGPIVETVVRIPVSGMSRSCETLRVDFGALDLNVQGRTIHINDFAVHVSDPARGPLGRALCSAANAPEDVNALVASLNEIVDLVGCLMRGASACPRRST